VGGSRKASWHVANENISSSEFIHVNTFMIQNRPSYNRSLSIYIYKCKTDCMYVPVSLFHATNRWINLHQILYRHPHRSTQGRFSTQVWPCQPNPQTPGYPKLNYLISSPEKKLCSAKMSKWVTYFSRAALAPSWLVF